GEVGQLPHREPMAPLGPFGEHLLSLLLAADAPAAVYGAGCVGGKDRGELRPIPALLGQTYKPLPGQGDGLGDAVGLLGWAADVAEVAAGVGLDAGQDEQEAGMERGHREAHVGRPPKRSRPGPWTARW